MPLPANVSMVEIEGQYWDSDGSGSEGWVILEPVPLYLLDATASPPATIIGNRYEFELVDGAIPAGSEIIATDDVDLNPTGWTYRVTINLKRVKDHIQFYMFAPAADSPIDLTTVATASTSGGTAIMYPSVVALTQTAYDALDPPNPNVLYVIVPA